MKLQLPSVTLCATFTVKHAATRRAFDLTSERVSFRNRIVITDDASGFDLSDHDTVITIPRFTNYEDVCVWYMCDAPALLLPLMGTHILGIHWDGFVVNPSAWKDENLSYDMIGGPAPWLGNERRINGNTGFVLQSHKFLETVRDFNFPRDTRDCHPSDRILCVDRRAEMESRGVRFAPNDLAYQFSREDEPPYQGSFGFHGRKMVMDLVERGIF